MLFRRIFLIFIFSVLITYSPDILAQCTADSECGPDQICDTSTGNCLLCTGGDPLATALLLDNSGSMEDNDPMELRKTASKTFLDTLAASSSQNLAAVFDFSEEQEHTGLFLVTRTDFPWAALDPANLGAAKTAVDGILLGGGTPLFNSAEEVCRDMKSTDHFNTADTNSNSIDGVARKVLVILSDGEDNFDDKTRDDVINCLTSGSGNDMILTFTVGLEGPSGIEADAEADLTAIANATGGRFLKASDATQLEQIFRSLACVIAGSPPPTQQPPPEDDGAGGGLDGFGAVLQSSGCASSLHGTLIAKVDLVAMSLWSLGLSILAVTRLAKGKN